jgi:hypothetical protein
MRLPQIVSPPFWYALHWFVWLAAWCGFMWFAGPSIIARGIVLARKVTGQ